MIDHPLHSRAEVATDRPERWAKQLSSHLGRKVEATVTDRGYSLAIGDGVGLIEPEAGRLILEAHASNEQNLELVESVLARHLERFAEKDGLTVSWIR